MSIIQESLIDFPKRFLAIIKELPTASNEGSDALDESSVTAKPEAALEPEQPPQPDINLLMNRLKQLAAG